MLSLLDIFFYQREDLPIFCKNGFAEYVFSLAARFFMTTIHV